MEVYKIESFFICFPEKKKTDFTQPNTLKDELEKLQKQQMP
jgi:hypothetical protein